MFFVNVSFPFNKKKIKLEYLCGLFVEDYGSKRFFIWFMGVIVFSLCGLYELIIINKTFKFKTKT